MPPGGAPTRAAQLATLEEIIHAHVVDERFGELFEELEPYAASLPHDSDDASLIRVARRDWDRARRVPTELAVEFAQAAAAVVRGLGEGARGVGLRLVPPSLERIVDLRRRYIECFAPYDDAYDVLLEDYEPGMRTSEIREIFAVLAPELRELVAEHATTRTRTSSCGGRSRSRRRRRSRASSSRRSARRGTSSGSTRPCIRSRSRFGLGDIRLTSRYSEDDLLSLFTAMHECGHGLYEWGVSPSLERTPLCRACPRRCTSRRAGSGRTSSAARSRSGAGSTRASRRRSPSQLGAVPLEDFHRAVNRVRRSFIRVDADETSYGLHVILRFELEQELLSGRLAVKDLPDAWNSRFEELMGVSVPDDALGVLQDAHWSGGGFGYFPTYLLGTVLSVQIWEQARAAIPTLEEQIERGEFADLHAWLRETIYALGRKLTPAETVERAVGGPIDPQPYLAYLRGK